MSKKVFFFFFVCILCIILAKTLTSKYKLVLIRTKQFFSPKYEKKNKKTTKLIRG